MDVVTVGVAEPETTTAAMATSAAMLATAVVVTNGTLRYLDL